MLTKVCVQIFLQSDSIIKPKTRQGRLLNFAYFYNSYGQATTSKKSLLE
jgi:hypothetical protein